MIESRCQRANDTASTAFNTDPQPIRLKNASLSTSPDNGKVATTKITWLV